MAGLDEGLENPYDPTAEKALIGVTLMSPELCRQHFLAIRPDDWYVPSSRHIAIVIAEMLAANRPVDPNTVLVEAQSRGLVPARINPAAVFDAVQAAWMPESAPLLAQRIRDLSAARKLSEAATRLAQRMEAAWSSGVDRADIASAVSEARRACDEAEQIAADLTIAPPTPMGEFLAVQDERSWLIPGLLERMERIVLTGAEGGGKTVLCTQLATCMAGGTHPFTGEPLGSGDRHIRVLVVDCENSPAQSRRRFKWMIGQVDAARHKHGLSPVNWSERMFIDMRPAGIDLLSGADAAWLERAIVETAPDLLVLGPLYKLHHANPSDETAARELVWVLDGLRERHGFALLTEAHAGNATDPNGDRMMRPLGSSLFRRWPEFGFGLLRSKTDPGGSRASVVDVVSWRGSREERSWPSKLQHSHILPWMPADPDYYATLPRTA
ncbi:AAA family ATPase [Nocardia abscessus]|uniref:AAA family ATPase n=1 Tax=Nocardia abscessus TaxID=120957 RepID=UPI0002DC63B9|nr:AAA family ATPase [Nocardia abscessus]MCC3333549.1 AAA family ATPase [Nocardia abscessus]